MARARKGKAVQTKIQALLYGDPFTGKSTFALQSMYLKRPDGKPFRVLYLDPESGSVDDYLSDLEADGINLDNLYIVYTQSLKEVNEYIRKVTNNEDLYELDDEGNETDDIVLDADGDPFRADLIVVDGATILNLTTKQGAAEFSKVRAKVRAENDNLIGDAKLVKVEGAGIELKDYQGINFKGNDLILSLTGSGKHYIVTARETDEKKTITLPDKTTNSVVTGKKIAEGFKGMDYNAKSVFRFFRDEEDDRVVKMKVVKDRTGTYEELAVIEDPSIIDFQTMIDKTKNNSKLIIQNALGKGVSDELNNLKKEYLGEDTKDDSKVDNKNKEAEDLKLLKKQTMNGLKSITNPIQKKAVKTALMEAGLNKPSNIKTIEQAKQALEIVNKNKQ